MRDTFIIFDLEATCYEKDKPFLFVNEIIEIGAIKLDHEGNEIDRFAEFCRPTLYPTISDFCHKLTTITQADIDAARPLKEVLADFLDWAEGSTLISWGHYDKLQIMNDMRENSMRGHKELLRNHKSLKHLHGEWNGLGSRGVGMGRALRHERLTLEGTHHRGIDDALNIARIFRKYIHKFTTLE